VAAWRQDLTYTLRRHHSKAPSFAAAAVVSIALGIAANTTIFRLLAGICGLMFDREADAMSA
jgi:hypothetical protein